MTNLLTVVKRLVNSSSAWELWGIKQTYLRGEIPAGSYLWDLLVYQDYLNECEVGRKDVPIILVDDDVYND